MLINHMALRQRHAQNGPYRDFTAPTALPAPAGMLARLGKVVAAEINFFNVSGGVNRCSAALTRFDFGPDGKPRSGYGFSAHSQREPILSAGSTAADDIAAAPLSREGLTLLLFAVGLTRNLSRYLHLSIRDRADVRNVPLN